MFFHPALALYGLRRTNWFYLAAIALEMPSDIIVSHSNVYTDAHDLPIYSMYLILRLLVASRQSWTGQPQWREREGLARACPGGPGSSLLISFFSQNLVRVGLPWRLAGEAASRRLRWRSRLLWRWSRGKGFQKRRWWRRCCRRRWVEEGLGAALA